MVENDSIDITVVFGVRVIKIHRPPMILLIELLLQLHLTLIICNDANVVD